MDIDLTRVCEEACVYQLDFQATCGAPPEIQSLQYVFDGLAVPEHVQKGDRADRYYVSVPGLGKPLGLRAVVRISGDTKNAKGALMIQKKSGR